MSEDELFLHELRSNRNEAYIQLYTMIIPMAKKLAWENGLSTQEANDITQEAVVAFYDNSQKPGFTLTCKLTTYMYSILRNQVRQLHSERTRSRRYVDTEDDFIDSVEQPSKYSDNEKLLGLVSKRLNDRCRKILNDYYVKDLSMIDVAKENGLGHADSAKSQKAKCLKELRRIFFNETHGG